MKNKQSQTCQNFMTEVFLILSLICSFFSPTQASFFGDTVHTVRVYFANPNFWPSLDSTHLTETYIMCKVIIDNVDTLDSVGIRLKGNSSYGHPGRKKSFHLKFDEYIDGRDYRGNDRLTFNNGFKDPTFLREKLASEIFHNMGVPCPRVCWSVVYYNDTYWGFYTTVDPINKDALTRFFGENDGNLYKGDPNGTLEWLGSSVYPYRTRYEKETNVAVDDWSDLIGLINFINNTSDAVFSNGICDQFDVFGFARMWAVNTFLVNLDSYQGTGHNYFLYFDCDTNGRYIVWDMNEAFGVFTFGMSASTLRTLPIDWHQLGRPLAARLFEDWTPFWQLVYCALHELLETDLAYSTFDARVTALANLVRPYVYADGNKMYTNANFETNLTYDITTSFPPYMTIPGLRSFIQDRGAYIASRLGSCAEIDVSNAVLINEVMASNAITIADEAGEYDDWIEIYNPADTAMNLSYWWLTDDINEPRKWSIPRSTVIPPHGYLLIWADSDPEQGNFHASFKLDAGREAVAIFSSDFTRATLCDSISWLNMPTDSSFGRYPNGTAHWQICLAATPGAENTWGSIFVNETSSLPDVFGIAVHPNPFNSAATIQIDNEGQSSVPLNISIFNIDGRLVSSLAIASP